MKTLLPEKMVPPRQKNPGGWFHSTLLEQMRCPIFQGSRPFCGILQSLPATQPLLSRRRPCCTSDAALPSQTSASVGRERGEKGPSPLGQRAMPFPSPLSSLISDATVDYALQFHSEPLCLILILIRYLPYHSPKLKLVRSIPLPWRCLPFQVCFHLNMWPFRILARALHAGRWQFSVWM